MKNNILVKILYLNESESEYLDSRKVELEELKNQDDVRGIRLCYQINGQIIEKSTDILFGERVTLAKLKREHSDNSEYQKYIEELEQAEVKDVALIKGRYYSSLYEGDITYSEFKSYMTFDKLKQVELEEDMDIKMKKSDKFVTLASYYNEENQAIVPFIISILKRMEVSNAEEIIEYLYSLNIQEEFICEVVSVCSFFSPKGVELLNYWNDNFYILKNSHSKLKLVRA